MQSRHSKGTEILLVPERTRVSKDALLDLLELQLGIAGRLKWLREAVDLV